MSEPTIAELAAEMRSCITTPQPLATLAGLGVITVLVLPNPAPEGLVGERIGIYADKTEPEVDYDMGDWRVTRVPDVTITIGPGEDVHLPGKWIVGNMLDEAPMRIYSLHPGHIVASATLLASHPIGHLSCGEDVDLSERRPIPSWPGYEVTITGEVWTASSHRFPGKVMGQRLRPPSKYLNVWMSRDGKKGSERVHRLVAEAWLVAVPGTHLIRHYDGDRTNNAAWNLRRGTDSDNAKDAYRLGERSTTRTPYPAVSDAEAAEMRRLAAEGLTQVQIGLRVKRGPNTVGAILGNRAPRVRKPRSVLTDDLARSRWAYILSDPAPTTTRCPWCDGTMGDPERMDEAWSYYGTVEPGSIPPCPVCIGPNGYPVGSCEPIRVAGGHGVWVAMSDGDEDICGETYDHDLRLIDERDGRRAYECRSCGAEIVEDADEPGEGGDA